MRRLADFLIRLYPAEWRARYGEEFQALLEDAPPDARALFDLLKGALQMQSSIVNFPRLALVLSGAGLLAGLAVSYLFAPRYVSMAEIAVSSPVTESHRSLPDVFMQLRSEVMSRTSLSGIIQDPRLDLYPRERYSTPLEDVIETMRKRDLKVELVEHPGLTGKDWMAFRVTVAYTNAHKAQQVAQTLITKFQEGNFFRQREASRAGANASPSELQSLEDRMWAIEKKLGIASGNPPAWQPPFGQGQQRASGVGVNLEVIDPPSLPEKPAAPNRAMFAALGFGSGLAIAVVVVVFRRRTPPAVAISA